MTPEYLINTIKAILPVSKMSLSDGRMMRKRDFFKKQRDKRRSNNDRRKGVEKGIVVRLSTKNDRRKNDDRRSFNY